MTKTYVALADIVDTSALAVDETTDIVTAPTELRFTNKLRSDNRGTYPTAGWYDRSPLYLFRSYSAPQTEGFLRHNIFSGIEQRGATGFTERPEGLSVNVRDASGVQEQNISGATNASPIVVTTSTSHTYADGERVAIWGVLGNTNANGYYYVDVLSSTTFALYTDTTLTTPRAGNAAYTSGGKATNRPILYGMAVTVTPSLARTGLSGGSGPTIHGDDVLAYGAFNGGTAKATDCFYIGKNDSFTSGAPEWISSFLNDANSDYAFRTTATHVNGIKLDEATFTGHAIKVGQGDIIGARNAAGSADVDILSLTASDELQLMPGGANIGLWDASDPTPANGSGRVLHLLRSDAASAAELRIENTVNQGLADINLYGKTAAGVAVRARFYASEFQGWLGTVSNHNFVFGVNNSPRFEFGTSGGFAVRNTANTAYVFTIFDSGNVQIFDTANVVLGTTTGTKIGTATTQKIGFWNATPVVRPTGWGAATGTATRTTFATTTVTLSQLAERVKALEDDLITIGILGA